MAREHARILCSIWRPDSEFRNRSSAAQRLYFLVLSQRELNNAGVIPLMVGKWSRAAPDTSVADMEKALAELIEHRYFVVDEDTEELLVRTFMRNDGILKHPHMRRSGLRSAEQVESPRLRAALAVELTRSGHPEALAVASQLHGDDAGTTHPDDTPTTQRDAIPTASNGVPAQPNSTGTQVPNAMPSSQVRGWGGVGEGGGVPVPEVVEMGGKDASPHPANDLLEQRPADRCTRHAGQPGDPGPCRSCADARQAAERWDTDAAKARVLAVRACRWCNPEGWRIDPEFRRDGPLRPGVRCDHTPLAEHRARVGTSR